ncbi:MAG: hypothetical protein Q4A68_06585 [Anaerobiospirillum succiniciproducens]|uniref:hypothetical protein n=1 Tax=Anaerobiospirillum succiniciproducens TaxID=13335 RepID=UPI0026DBD1FD|nr:hypothetical protein [Anaerobiospirillum succiniciproducens]MDO4676226.1 hypothetical protein [Anaerobiospirillum succiniciproducens]
MIDLVSSVDALFSYMGATIFALGLIFCLIPRTFRFGIFAMLAGDVPLALAIAFPRKIIEFLLSQGITPEQFPDPDSGHIYGIVGGVAFVAFLFLMRALLLKLFKRSAEDDDAPVLPVEDSFLDEEQDDLDLAGKGARNQKASGKKGNKRASSRHLSADDVPLSLDGADSAFKPLKENNSYPEPRTNANGDSTSAANSFGSAALQGLSADDGPDFSNDFLAATARKETQAKASDDNTPSKEALADRMSRLSSLAMSVAQEQEQKQSASDTNNKDNASSPWSGLMAKIDAANAQGQAAQPQSAQENVGNELAQVPLTGRKVGQLLDVIDNDDAEAVADLQKSYNKKTTEDTASSSAGFADILNSATARQSRIEHENQDELDSHNLTDALGQQAEDLNDDRYEAAPKDQEQSPVYPNFKRKTVAEVLASLESEDVPDKNDELKVDGAHSAATDFDRQAIDAKIAETSEVSNESEPYQSSSANKADASENQDGAADGLNLDSLNFSFSIYNHNLREKQSEDEDKGVSESEEKSSQAPSSIAKQATLAAAQEGGEELPELNLDGMSPGSEDVLSEEISAELEKQDKEHDILEKSDRAAEALNHVSLLEGDFENEASRFYEYNTTRVDSAQEEAKSLEERMRRGIQEKFGIDGSTISPALANDPGMISDLERQQKVMEALNKLKNLNAAKQANKEQEVVKADAAASTDTPASTDTAASVDTSTKAEFASKAASDNAQEPKSVSQKPSAPVATDLKAMVAAAKAAAAASDDVQEPKTDSQKPSAPAVSDLKAMVAAAKAAAAAADEKADDQAEDKSQATAAQMAKDSVSEDKTKELKSQSEPLAASTAAALTPAQMVAQAKLAALRASSATKPKPKKIFATLNEGGETRVKGPRTAAEALKMAFANAGSEGRGLLQNAYKHHKEFKPLNAPAEGGVAASIKAEVAKAKAAAAGADLNAMDLAEDIAAMAAAAAALPGSEDFNTDEMLAAVDSIDTSGSFTDGFNASDFDASTLDSIGSDGFDSQAAVAEAKEAVDAIAASVADDAGFEVDEFDAADSVISKPVSTSTKSERMQDMLAKARERAAKVAAMRSADLAKKGASPDVAAAVVAAASEAATNEFNVVTPVLPHEDEEDPADLAASIRAAVNTAKATAAANTRKDVPEDDEWSFPVADNEEPLRRISSINPGNDPKVKAARANAMARIAKARQAAQERSAAAAVAAAWKKDKGSIVSKHGVANKAAAALQSRTASSLVANAIKERTGVVVPQKMIRTVPDSLPTAIRTPKSFAAGAARINRLENVKKAASAAGRQIPNTERKVATPRQVLKSDAVTKVDVKPQSRAVTSDVKSALEAARAFAKSRDDAKKQLSNASNPDEVKIALEAARSAARNRAREAAKARATIAAHASKKVEVPDVERTEPSEAVSSSLEAARNAARAVLARADRSKSGVVPPHSEDVDVNAINDEAKLKSDMAPKSDMSIARLTKAVASASNASAQKRPVASASASVSAAAPSASTAAPASVVTASATAATSAATLDSDEPKRRVHSLKGRSRSKADDTQAVVEEAASLKKRKVASLKRTIRRPSADTQE